MKKKNNISYSVIILCLFWLFGAVGFAFSGKQSSEIKKDKPQTEISAYQAKALVPVMGSATLCPTYFLIFEVSFLVNNSANHSFQKPIFKISFFEKVFEHLIAPQAP